MGKNFLMVAKTLYGLEDLLVKELRDLGASEIEKGVRSVSFQGDTGFMYKANLCCRTAVRILKPISSFNVFDEDQLYKRIYEIPWENHMDSRGTLSVESTVFSKRFTHSKYIALKTKDAIVDRFRDRFGHRPDIDRYHASLHVHIHIDRQIATVSLNSSGPSLHRRGYRVAPVAAPVSEVLAAGLIMLSGWSGQCDFLDPMCGGGTIPIEAAMIACNIPANINRAEFGFEHWPDYDPELFELIRNSALKRVKEFHFKIYARDRDPLAIRKTKANVGEASLEEFIDIQQADFINSEKEDKEKNLFILTNPPYDQRLSLRDVSDFYGRIGSTLKHGYAGSEAWLFAANETALKSIGLKPKKKIKLYNGKLEARLVGFNLFSGTLKARKSTSTS
ncbi:THUMP domain-containing class I SAM-dependent RNA methyltransferase [Aureitalea marina]|uniref:RNA methyltransferase n=1 Tax=Aureitalea marina TaxID=930804 RepID=A0A2S7KNU0_9FLAO|nr:THUMP domain-containing protein [Aureitalea marina]PQB04270.1 RNA methyltransferase [Aureitalea marina]